MRLALLLLLAASTWAQVPIGTTGSGGSSGGTTSAVRKGLLVDIPPTCAVADLYYATDASIVTGGWKIYSCTAINVWNFTGMIAGPSGALDCSLSAIPNQTMCDVVAGIFATLLGNNAFVGGTMSLAGVTAFVPATTQAMVTTATFDDNPGLDTGADASASFYPNNWFRYDPGASIIPVWLNTDLPSLPAYTLKATNSSVIFSFGIAGSVATKFPDYFSAGNFKAFNSRWRGALTDGTATAKAWLGWCDTYNTTSLSNCLVLIYDSAIGANWRVAVITAGVVSATSIVAADTSAHSFYLRATASGSLVGCVDTTCQPQPTTFPTATNWYFQWGIQSTAGATVRGLAISEMRTQIALPARN